MLATLLLLLALASAVNVSAGRTVCISHASSCDTPSAAAAVACFPEDACTVVSGHTSAVFSQNASSGVNVVLFNSRTCEQSARVRDFTIPNGECTNGASLNAGWAAMWCKRCRVFCSVFSYWLLPYILSAEFIIVRRLY
jgi:hypothetical protein